MSGKLSDQADFLARYSVSAETFEKSGLQWEDLQNVHQQHIVSTPSMDLFARYVADMIRQVPEVHSIKYRVKDAEHLIEKIIRKKGDDPEREITPENFREQITDLVGVRALHLFKTEWRNIHQFIQANFELSETPTANVRRGDPEEIRELYKAEGCEVKEHKAGYRSVHYLIKSQPSKIAIVAELQVRTIFEEAWSEIDHRIHYPYSTDNKLVSELLLILNRLAGSADELGSFVATLHEELKRVAATEAENVRELKRKEQQLADTIAKLSISEEQKQELQQQIKKVSKNELTGMGQATGVALWGSILNTPGVAYDVIPPWLGAVTKAYETEKIKTAEQS